MPGKHPSEYVADFYAQLMAAVASVHANDPTETRIQQEELDRLGDLHDEFRGDARGLTTKEFRRQYPAIAHRQEEDK